MTNETDSNRPLCFQYRDEQIEKAMENFKGAAKHHGETDIYGMSAEERAAFEADFSEPVRPGDASKDGRYLCRDTHIEALSWAACAKLYRERLAEMQAENIRAWGEYNEARAAGAKAQIKNLALMGEIVSLRAEVERLRADAARYAFLRELSEAGADFLRRG